MKSAGEVFRARKTQEYLANHGIRVEAIDYPKVPAIIVSTHPSLDETIIYRAVDSKALHLVHFEAIKHTGVTPLDEVLATHVSGVIPVYRDNQQKRQKSYALAVRMLEKGRTIFINPTGQTACSTDLPSIHAIKIGGLIRILKRSQFCFPVYPAVIGIKKGGTTLEGKIKDDSQVVVRFGQRQLDLNRELTDGRMDEVAIQREIYSAWEGLLA